MGASARALNESVAVGVVLEHLQPKQSAVHALVHEALEKAVRESRSGPHFGAINVAMAVIGFTLIAFSVYKLGGCICCTCCKSGNKKIASKRGQRSSSRRRGRENSFGRQRKDDDDASVISSRHEQNEMDDLDDESVIDDEESSVF